MPFSPSGDRKFFSRAFGKLQKGSVRGSIFSLCASAVGSGVLSLPYVLALNGWVLGTFFILVGAIAATWSCMILADCGIKSGNTSFHKLAYFCGGRKLQLILQINILVYMFGSCISYQIISKYFLGHLPYIVSSLLAFVLKRFGVDPVFL
jgi:amino acid permease